MYYRIVSKLRREAETIPLYLWPARYDEVSRQYLYVLIPFNFLVMLWDMVVSQVASGRSAVTPLPPVDVQALGLKAHAEGYDEGFRKGMYHGIQAQRKKFRDSLFCQMLNNDHGRQVIASQIMIAEILAPHNRQN